MKRFKSIIRRNTKSETHFLQPTLPGDGLRRKQKQLHNIFHETKRNVNTLKMICKINAREVIKFHLCFLLQSTSLLCWWKFSSLSNYWRINWVNSRNGIRLNHERWWMWRDGKKKLAIEGIPFYALQCFFFRQVRSSIKWADCVMEWERFDSSSFWRNWESCLVKMIHFCWNN